MRRALFLMPSDRMGGAERLIRTIAREAARSGAFDRVDIFIQCWSNSGTLDDLNDGVVKLNYAHGTRIYRGIFALLRTLVQGRYDLVFSSHTHLNAIASVMRALRLLRTRRLVTRESTPFFERDFGLFRRALKALYWLYGGQDLIICQTERMRISFDRNTHGRFCKLAIAVPNPIDLDRIRDSKQIPLPAEVQAIPIHRKKIVWCGRLSAVKAPVRALLVLRQLHDLGFHDAHLIIIGDGPERQLVEAQITALALEENVTLLGHLANPLNVMAGCDVGLLTSDMEGFPNVVLEMLACGVSFVVTTNCAGDLSEIPGVRVSASADPKLLASLVLRLNFDERPASTFVFARRLPEVYLSVIRGDPS